MSSNKAIRIAKIIMNVEESGIARIYFKESDQLASKDYIIYNGFFKFPVTKYLAVTVGEFETQNNVHRIIINLKPNLGKLEGVITGWRTLDLSFFSSPIYFEKIPEFESDQRLEEILEKNRPARYILKNENDFKEELSELKRIQGLTFEIIK